MILIWGAVWKEPPTPIGCQYLFEKLAKYFEDASEVTYVKVVYWFEKGVCVLCVSKHAKWDLSVILLKQLDSAIVKLHCNMWWAKMYNTDSDLTCDFLFLFRCCHMGQQHGDRAKISEIRKREDGWWWP